LRACASGRNMSFQEAGSGLETARLAHELDQRHQVRRRRRIVDVGVGDHPGDLRGRAALVLGQREVDLGGVGRALLDERVGLLVAREHGFADPRVVLVERLGRHLHAVGVRPSDRVVGLEHRPHAGCRQLVVVERRHAKMPGDLRLAREHGHKRVRVSHRHRPGIEPLELVEAPLLGCRNLQHHRLAGDLGRRHSYSVLVREVRDRLDAWGTRDQHVGHRLHGAHRTHRARRVGGFLPQSGERRRGDVDELDAAAQQRVVERARPRQRQPAHLQAGQAEASRVLLDQLLRLHHHLRQERQAILPAEPDARDLGRRRPGHRRQRQRARHEPPPRYSRHRFLLRAFIETVGCLQLRGKPRGATVPTPSSRAGPVRASCPRKPPCRNR
jgi:hypothetical protein